MPSPPAPPRLCRCRAVLLLCGAAGCFAAAGCGARPPAAPPDEAPASPTASATSGVAQTGCFSGGEPAVIRARAVVRADPSGQPLSVVDLELAGPRRDALRACYGALLRELELGPISGDELRVEVVQPCRAGGLPAYELPAAAVLIDLRSSDASTLLGVERLAGDRRFACNLAAFDGVQVAIRRHSAYRDSERCERARQLLAQTMDRAEQQARRAAARWLDEAIATEQSHEQRACAAEAATPRCQRHRARLELLRARHRALETSSPATATRIHLVCREAP